MTDERARVEAWMNEVCPHQGHYDKHHCLDCLLAFAAEQRDEEREACAKAAFNSWKDAEEPTIDKIVNAIRALAHEEPM